ncbi:hypothetical protein F5Y16DRAFT_401750 [Xylariaceae sp. FL0255]|nr:hypothetical protein F5Y16DRAFT_401750 [Xylariaceae sp. FL0255]
MEQGEPTHQTKVPQESAMSCVQVTRAPLHPRHIPVELVLKIHEELVQIPAVFWFVFIPSTSSRQSTSDNLRTYQPPPFQPWGLEAAKVHQEGFPSLDGALSLRGRIFDHSLCSNNTEAFANASWLFSPKPLLRNVTSGGQHDLPIEGLPPMDWEINGERVAPLIRLDTDWVFMQNYLSVLRSNGAVPYCQGIQYVQNVGFTLDDFHDELHYRFLVQKKNFKEAWAVEELNRVWNGLCTRPTEFTCLHILVGEIPHEPTYNSLEVVRVLDGADGEIKLQPDDSSKETKAKIKLVIQIMERITMEFKEAICRMVNDRDIRQKLYHGSASEFDEWVSLPWGQWWLLETQRGQKWFHNKAGRWWLSSSDQGKKWLDSQRGVDWLKSKDSNVFLDSLQGACWYQSSISNNQAELLLRGWHKSEKGEKWATLQRAKLPPSARRPCTEDFSPNDDYDEDMWDATFVDLNWSIIWYQWPRRYQFVQKKRGNIRATSDTSSPQCKVMPSG